MHFKSESVEGGGGNEGVRRSHCDLTSVLASFMATWHKLELSEKRETELRKCLLKTGLQAGL